MTGASLAGGESLQAFKTAWRKGSRWWLTELRECAPPSWRRLLLAEKPYRLSILNDDGAVIGVLETPFGTQEKRFDSAGFDHDSIDRWLVEVGSPRHAIELDLVLDRGLFFQRTISLPRSELDALDRIMAQETVHRTPFQLDEVWQGVTPANPPAGGSLAIYDHWIIPRDRVEAEMAGLGLRAADFDFIALKQPDGKPLRVAAMKASQLGDPPWVLRTIRTLAIACLVSLVLGVAGLDWWTSSKAEALDDALSDVEQTMQEGSGTSASFRLFARKAAPGTLAIWDELSRLIPDHTFLTEMSIAGNAVTISGLSSDAPHLVRIIDGSRLFAGAALAGAITPDATEQKSRFRITIKLRGVDAPRASAANERIAP